MTISGISSSSYSIGQMSTMRTRTASGSTEQSAAKGKPNLVEMFTKLDADGSGGLDSTEVQNLTEKISEATGVSVDLAEFLATYDSDSDGALSEGETATALEANRPQGPPPEEMGAMQGNGPDYAQMFTDADTDEDGNLSVTEAESLAGIVSNATGSTMAASDLIASYDANGDGVLSEEETATALEANRPAGPPPPAENLTSTAEGLDSVFAEAIEKYLKMAAVGTEGQAGDDLFSMLSGNSGSVSNIA